MSKLLTWYFGTRDKYDALATKDQEGIYFLNDTGELYYQGKQYMDTVIMYKGEKPTANIPTDKLYFNTDTLVGEVYKDGAWVQVISPATAAVLDKDGNGVITAISGVAVKDFIDAKFGAAVGKGIVEIAYDETLSKITVKDSSGTTKDLAINEFAKSIKRDEKTGKISMFAADGTTELANITIKPDMHVTGGSYNETDKAIDLNMSDGSVIKIAASDMINLYNEQDSASINVTKELQDGVIFLKMDVNVSKTADNGLVAKDDGLFYSGGAFVEKITGAVADDLLGVTADGSTKDTGIKVGGAALAATPDAKTVATETAVAAIKKEAATTMDATYVKADSIRGSFADFCKEWGFQG